VRGARAARFRIAAIVLVGMYFAGSIREINSLTRWFAGAYRPDTWGDPNVDARLRQKPGSAFLLQDVDNPLFQSGFQDEPFRLIGAPRVFLVPGSEKEDRGEGRSRRNKSLSTVVCAGSGSAGPRQCAVLHVAHEPRDVTAEYYAVLRADPMARRRDFVDVADPLYNTLLGPMWPPAERSFRWSPKRATVKLSGPLDTSQRLYVTGYTPSAVLAAGTGDDARARERTRKLAPRN